MPTKKNAATRSLLHHSNGTRQPFTIASGHGRKWWAMRSSLAKGKITPQHKESSLAECVRYCHQQLRLAVGPGSMCEHQRITS
jgi:hypothetical protein